MLQLPIGRSQTGKVRCDDFLQRKAAFRRWVDLPDYRGDPAHRLFPAFMFPDICGKSARVRFYGSLYRSASRGNRKGSIIINDIIMLSDYNFMHVFCVAVSAMK
jgi:hypothetical protein